MMLPVHTLVQLHVTHLFPRDKGEESVKGKMGRDVFKRACYQAKNSRSKKCTSGPIGTVKLAIAHFFHDEKVLPPIERG